MSMLEVKDLQVYYGVIQALKGISFHVEQGEVIALIGANGAGKTTTLQTLTGIIPAKAGSIIYEGKNLTKTPAHKIVEMGMAHVPEGRRVFADMSVYENLLMGAYTRKDKNEIAQSLEMVYKRFPRLKERTGQRAGTLSGGEQQMLAMGRALMSKPKIILMDEPSMGLSPIFVNAFFISKKRTLYLISLFYFTEKFYINSALIRRHLDNLLIIKRDSQTLCQHFTNGATATSILSCDCDYNLIHTDFLLILPDMLSGQIHHEADHLLCLPE